MIGSSIAAEHMGVAGLDFLVIDTQHGEVDQSNLAATHMAAARSGQPVLARVISSDPSVIMRVLDMGVDGVIVPMINTVEEAQTAVDSCRYAPVGNRSFGRIRASRSTIDDENDRIMCMPMIETIEALENVNAIAQTDGVDALFVGPFDLGMQMGIKPGDIPTSLKVNEVIARICEVARNVGIPVGSIASNEDHARTLLDCGVRFLSLGSDLSFIKEGAAARLKLAEKLQADAQNREMTVKL